MALGTAKLSKRAEENVVSNEGWELLSEALTNVYDREKNPNGAINLGVAESNLMYKELTEHMTKHFEIDAASHLTYGAGPAGSPRLQSALSGFFNTRLKANPPTAPSEFVLGSGLSAVVDMVTWCLCNEGEGILIPQPLYTSFEIDIPMRSRGVLVPVPFAPSESNEPYDLSVVFDAAANRTALEAALARSRNELGVEPRAVMLCNPHNPLGRCYSRETIQEIARFCAAHDLHLLSDEIYACSVFDNAEAPDAEGFRSVVDPVLGLADLIAPDLVHVLYGMSKDFCCNGLRLGALYSRNAKLRAAFTSIAVFSWPSYLAQDRWAAILEDAPFLERFIATNRTRLGAAYKAVADGLDRRGVPFFRGGNAGFFVWLDLSKWLAGAPGEKRETVVARHDAFMFACIRNGVFLRHGYHFYTERPGWVRITFTVDKEDIELALDRIAKTLEQFPPAQDAETDGKAKRATHDDSESKDVPIRAKS